MTVTSRLTGAALRVISGYDLWVAAHTGAQWLHGHRRIRRALHVGLIYSGLVAVGGSAAAAAEGEGSVVGRWLPVAGLTDTRGIPIEQYLTLPLDRGSLTHPVMSFLALGTDFLWGAHMVFVMVVLNMLRYVISFGWVDAVATPVEALVTQISSLVAQVGYVPMALSAAGVAVGVMVLRGRYGRATSELLVVAILAALLAGPLANPVALLVGETGLLTGVQRSSAELVVELTGDAQPPTGVNGEPLGPEQIISATLFAETVDTFVRAPAQMIAFGALLDGQCEEVYDEQLRERQPLNVTDESMRKAMGECDRQIEHFIGSALAVKLGVQIVVQAGGVGLLVLLVSVCGMLVLLIAVALYNGARAAVTGFLALLPGSRRTGFFDALLQAALSVVLIPFVLVFLIVLMRIINQLMEATASDLLVMMITVDLLIVVGVILLVRMRTQAMDKARRFAQRLATLGTGQHGAPRPSRFTTTAQHIAPWAREIAVRKMLSPRTSPQRSTPWPGPAPDTRPDNNPGPGPVPDPGGPTSLPPGGPRPPRILGRPRPLALTMGPSPEPMNPRGPGNPPAPSPGPAPGKPPKPGSDAAGAVITPGNAARLGAALTTGSKIAAAVPGAGTATAAGMAAAGKGLSGAARAGQAARAAAAPATTTASPTRSSPPTGSSRPTPLVPPPVPSSPGPRRPLASTHPDPIPPREPAPPSGAPVATGAAHRRAPAMGRAAARAALDARLAAARARTERGA